MVRRKDDGGTAVAEPVNPNDIAARVAAADAAARREQVVRDVEEWRHIILSIADGHEPDGKMLAAIGDIGRRLRLPPDAVSKAVAAVQQDRRNAAEVERMVESVERIKEREPELDREFKEVQERMRALQMEINQYQNLHRAYPFTLAAVAQNREENALMFAAIDTVADRVIATETGMGRHTFQNLDGR